MSVMIESPTLAPKAENRGIDCRVWERHSCDLPSMCQPVAARGPNEMNWLATVRDISCGGMGLISLRRFEPGSGLAIQIPVPDKQEDKTHLARVIHATRMPDGQWLMGCAFISPLSEEEIQRFIAMETSDSSDAEIQLASSGDDEPHSGVLDNVIREKGWDVVLSRILWEHTETGVRRVFRRLFLKGFWPLMGGTVLTIRLGTTDYLSSPVQLCVDSCRREGDDWIIRFSIVVEKGNILSHWFQQN